MPNLSFPTIFFPALGRPPDWSHIPPMAGVGQAAGHLQISQRLSIGATVTRPRVHVLLEVNGKYVFSRIDLHPKPSKIERGKSMLLVGGDGANGICRGR